MVLGIISDIHDNLTKLESAIAWLNGHADVLLCCGDLCSPFVIDVLKKFHGPVHIIFGNNDADLFRITRKCDDRVQAHGELLEMQLDGKKIAANHFDNIARPIAASGLYDLVCYGHNHRVFHQQTERTVVVNPGPILGIAFGPHGWEPVASTFATCDLSSMDVRFFELSPNGTVQPHAMC